MLLILAVCVFTTLLGNYILTPEFESESKLLISVGREGALPTTVMTQPLNVFLEREDQVNTQMQLLKSRFLMEETLKSLPLDWEETNLVHSDDLLSNVKSAIKTVAKAGVDGVRWLLESIDLIPKVAPEQRKVLSLFDRLGIEQITNTDVLRVTFRHPNPFAARFFLQAYLKTYIITDVRTSNSNTAMEFFAQQVESSLTELHRAEEEFSRFRNEANIYDLPKQKEKASEEMASLYKQITDSTLQIEASQQSLANYQNTAGEQIETAISTSLRNDPVVIETLKVLVANKMRLTKERKKLGENNPKIITLRAELKGIRASLKDEVIGTMQMHIMALKNENQGLRTQLAALQERAQFLDEKGISMEQLQRKVDLLRQSYMTYSEKQETSRINTMLDRSEINSVTITQPPTIPIKPVSPKRLLNLVLSIFAGLVLGFFYAMLTEMIGAAVNGPEEMNKALGSRNQIFLPYAPLVDFKEIMPENFRNSLQLLASMSLHSQASPSRLLMVVGAGPGVGCTTVSIMFARFLSERLGQKILLCDANFTDRSLSGSYELEDKPGLTDVLAGKTNVAGAVASISETLDILSGGKDALLPETLLSFSRSMRGGLDGLLERYDLVLFDASPLSSPESFNLAKIMDGVIVVAKAEKTRREVLRATKEQLDNVKAKLAGCVLNQRKFHIPSRFYRYL